MSLSMTAELQAVAASNTEGGEATAAAAAGAPELPATGANAAKGSSGASGTGGSEAEGAAGEATEGEVNKPLPTRLAAESLVAKLTLSGTPPEESPMAGQPLRFPTSQQASCELSTCTTALAEPLSAEAAKTSHNFTLLYWLKNCVNASLVTSGGKPCTNTWSQTWFDAEESDLPSAGIGSCLPANCPRPPNFPENCPLSPAFPPNALPQPPLPPLPQQPLRASTATPWLPLPRLQPLLAPLSQPPLPQNCFTIPWIMAILSHGEAPLLQPLPPFPAPFHLGTASAPPPHFP
mmetsp:Transcript_127903/g.322953  ORF Transcript_127903/g.322953 Transcript_127903/m.322953 type:complete len:292 (+) Transcript_127903:113-988(+)